MIKVGYAEIQSTSLIGFDGQPDRFTFILIEWKRSCLHFAFFSKQQTKSM